MTGLDALADADALLGEITETRTEPATSAQAQALALAVMANLPVLLWGEPGVGKSATLGQLADGLDVPLETVIASIHEPSDFAGLPIVGGDPARDGVPMAPPDWAVRVRDAGRGLLFFDELSSAPPAVQAALLRVVLERRVGSLELPPTVRIVAAANPAASAADGWHLAAPLANRFVHLTWTHDPQLVVRGLSGTWPHISPPRLHSGRGRSALARARATLAGFLSARPGLVHALPADPANRGGAWPSPRTWDMALRLLVFADVCGVRGDALGLALAGTVGDGPGIELLAFTQELDLPDPDRVLASPDDFALPDRGDRQHAFLVAIVEAVRTQRSYDRWAAGWNVLAKAVDAGVPDIAARAAADLAALRKPAWKAPAHVDAFADVLQRAGLLTG